MTTAEDLLKIKDKDVELICVKPDSTIYEALKLMNQYKIGAILVEDGGEIVGIWTERDLMRNILEEGFDIKTAKIKDYMTTSLVSVEHDENIYALQDKFLGIRLRHLLVRKEGKYIGLLSVGDVIKANLNEKNEELKKLNAIVSWEYYENWQWKKK
ncbi:MAG: CBS domain-containing protein [Calditrichia bacterium]